VAEAVKITALTGLRLATLMARHGVDAQQVGAALGLDAPSKPGRVANDSLALIATAPVAWLAIKQNEADGTWPAALADRLGDTAAVFDQSGAYCVFRLEGPAARQALQRGIAIDLDPAVFGPDDSVVSSLAHLDVIVWQAGGEGRFDVAVFRSYAEEFLAWADSVAATFD
jgi:sarcosine oxidase subunit gamma